MRDLRQDIEICNKAMKGPWTHDGCELVTEPCRRMIADGDYVPYPANMAFIAAAREGWPHAIGRAIKAEAEVLQWADMYGNIADRELSLKDKVKGLEAEVERLRKISRTLVDDIDAYHQDVVRLETENARLRKGRQYQESNAALQAKLDNAIDTAFDLEAKNARLRKVMNDVINIALNGDAEDWLALREVLAEV